MLEHGIVEAACSSWASPCLMADKADGSDTFCTDFRKLNAVTKPNCYLMEDCTDQVGSAKFVNKLDFLKGYWQVPLTAKAKNISSFIAPWGLFCYSVMTSGLRNVSVPYEQGVSW